MLYRALYVPAGHAPFPSDIVNEPKIARYVTGWGRENDAGFAAVDLSTLAPVGAAWIRLFSRDNQGYGLVDEQTPELSIALLPAHRNQGLGTLLLNQFISDAGLRYNAISLSVSAENPAVRLYQRLGFEVIRQEGDSLIMLKDSTQ
jgi:ribosomal protein S18 acetylase RimI-like enzyme